MSDFVCEPLSKKHDRQAFDCGVTVLNNYLAKIAKQDVKRKAAAVFVLSPKSEPSRVAGFYTLCSTSIEMSSLPQELAKRLPRYPEVPAILIGRLARDITYPGVGSLLLADALTRCVRSQPKSQPASSLSIPRARTQPTSIQSSASYHFQESLIECSCPWPPLRSCKITRAERGHTTFCPVFGEPPYYFAAGLCFPDN